MLREPDNREEVTTVEVRDSRMVSLTILKACKDLQTNSFFIGTEDSIDECDVVIRYFEVV